MIFEERHYQWKAMLNYFLAARDGSMEQQTISLGKSPVAKSLVRKFNKRKAKFLFLVPFKGIAMAVIDKKNYQNEFDLYYNTVKGKNSAKYFHQQAEKKGAQFRVIDPVVHEREILEINTSMLVRQGKVMRKEYLQAGNIASGKGMVVYGVFVEEKLVAYIRTMHLGEAVFISNILGHGAYLKLGIMYFLLLEVIRQVFANNGIRYILYDSYWGNSHGLVLFKKRFNFKACNVNWEM